MKQRNGLPFKICRFATTGLLVLAGTVSGWSQVSSPATPPPQGDSVAAAVHDLQVQVRELREAVVEIRSEAARYRAETAALRQELEVTRGQLSAMGNAPLPGAYGAPSTTAAAPAAVGPGTATPQERPLTDRVASLEESSQLLAGRIDEQYQTKVESASKYRLRLSGIVLLNLFSNRGVVDNQDFPSYAAEPTSLDPQGTFGATLRQSEIGLEVFGPRVAGARTTGQVQFDLSGGFPNTLNGNSYGLFRLRIASMRMDWDHTSIVAGQDNVFLSPLSPTSFASLAIPAFSYTGNLWGWVPQVRVEHRFDLSTRQSITLQGGILDNITGEPPYAQFDNIASAGERSSQPAYGVRVAWASTAFGQPVTLGAAGYYGRQDWALDRYADAWAGMTDWQIPLAPRVTLSGEFYRGRAVGAFGGGIGRSILYSGPPNQLYTQIRPLDSIGGWSQVKFRATSKLEFNGAFGIDNPYSDDVRFFPNSRSYYNPNLIRNRSTLINFVYRPRSNLLFSAEYRHLRTFEIDNDTFTAEQASLMMGILF